MRLVRLRKAETNLTNEGLKELADALVNALSVAIKVLGPDHAVTTELLRLVNEKVYEDKSFLDVITEKTEEALKEADEILSVPLAKQQAELNTEEIENVTATLKTIRQTLAQKRGEIDELLQQIDEALTTGLTEETIRAIKEKLEGLQQSEVA